MCMIVLPAYMSTHHVCTLGLQKSAEGIRCSGTGVTWTCWELNPNSLQVQVLLTAEPLIYHFLTF